jgi:hypothetical protein
MTSFTTERAEQKAGRATASDKESCRELTA